MQERIIKVLLVEDDPIITTIHKQMLMKLGCYVDTADNSFEALTFFKKNTYDLIVTDIGLPQMDGIELTARIRRKNKTKNPVPIIALTGYSEEQTRKDCFSAGVNEVIIKPISRKAMQELLQRYVN